MDSTVQPFSLDRRKKIFCILFSYISVTTSSESLNLHGKNKSSMVKSFENEFKRDWLPLPEHSTVPYLLLEARVGWNDACRGFSASCNCGKTSDRNFIASNFSVIFWTHVTIRENNLQQALGPSRALWPWPPISSLLRTGVFWGFGDLIKGFSRKIRAEKSIAGKVSRFLTTKKAKFGIPNSKKSYHNHTSRFFFNDLFF